MSAEPGDLLGRHDEWAALSRLLAAAGDGTSQVLVLRGDPGVGKSALLGALTDTTPGWCVLSAAGLAPEAELPYGGLHQLCKPLVGRIERLRGPQREALSAVFGLSEGAPPDGFLVGLATLSLLADAARAQPVLCVVDDAQWLDQATVGVLAFVARRLASEPVAAQRVALVCAARTDVLVGLPELTVRGLADADARVLLERGLPGRMDADVRDQILAECDGNPQALLELPRTWNPLELAGGFALPESQPLPSRAERDYERRLRELPTQTQLFLLAAAAEPVGDPMLLYAAARQLGVDQAAGSPATDAGLLRIGVRVRFTHPLVRSAAYRMAPGADRQRVHAALAEAIDGRRDPDRRAWHRARAATGPDEEVAAALADSADRAGARGGLAASAAFLTRATELTPNRTTRAQRALDAAFANLAAGALGSARALLPIAAGGPVDELQQARIELLRAKVVSGEAATPLLRAAAHRLEPLDAGLARETYLDALLSALTGSDALNHVRPTLAAEVEKGSPAEETRSALPEAAPSPGDLLLEAFSALVDDYAKAVPAARAAVQRLHTENHLTWLARGTLLAMALWDTESWPLLAARHHGLARQAGALPELPFILASRAHLLGYRGELAALAEVVAEATAIRGALGDTGTPPFAALCEAVWRGRVPDAEELLEQARRRPARSALVECSEAVLRNSLGEYEDALAAAVRATEKPHALVVHSWVLPELIEAATRTGRTELAAEALARLGRKTSASGTAWALGVEARARALVSDGEQAEEQYRTAIDHLHRAGMRAELGRARLLYGEWLRRISRRSDARRELTTAHETFTECGLAAFAERAQRELLALGSLMVKPALTKQATAEHTELSAQETHIARLAQDGLSNAEIGARLFLSARTVEWHLGKVFGKLGISSRRQLRGVQLP